AVAPRKAAQTAQPGLEHAGAVDAEARGSDGADEVAQPGVEVERAQQAARLHPKACVVVARRTLELVACVLAPGAQPEPARAPHTRVVVRQQTDRRADRGRCASCRLLHGRPRGGATRSREVESSQRAQALVNA